MARSPHRLLNTQRLAWMLAGLIVGLFLQWTQAEAFGGWKELVPVGVEAPLRPIIESELGPLGDTWSQSHDGQYSLVIAVDPFARTDVHDLFDNGGYRYRRIFYPLLAGGFGTFGGKTTLLGLLVVAALGLGLATAAAFDLSATISTPRWVIAGVLASPGLWLSVRMFTVDALALGLALAGLALWIRQRTLASLVLFALAVLTKEQYLLIPIALAGWSWFDGRKSAALLTGVVPVLPLAGWALFLSSRMPGAFAPRGNLAFLGIFDSWHVWRFTSSLDQALVVATLVGLVGACVLLIRSTSLLRWLMTPWIVLALVSSTWVWDLGNNAARVFAPIWVFDLIAIGLLLQRRPLSQVPHNPN